MQIGASVINSDGSTEFIKFGVVTQRNLASNVGI